MRLLPKDPEIGWTPYAWLVYLASFIVFVPGSPSIWSLSALTIVVFLALYFRAYWVRHTGALPYLAAIALLGLIWAPFNPGAAVFFVYAAAFAGWSPRRPALIMIAALALLVAIETVALHLTPQFWIPALVFTLLIGGINMHFSELLRAEARVRAAHQEVERLAALAERERIARDLHDVLGHSLTNIALKAELAAKLIGRDPARAAVELEEIAEVTRKALGQVRQTVRGYRSAGLEGELANAKLALHAAGINQRLELEKVELVSDAEQVLAIALREAITNVIRHSGARRCVIRLLDHEGGVRLEIEDDGCGGDAELGTGLAGIKRRMAEFGGSVDLSGRGGFRVRLTLPAIRSSNHASPGGRAEETSL